MNGDTLPNIVLSDGYIVSVLYNQGALNTPPNQSFGNETHFLAGQGINSLTLRSVRGSTVPELGGGQRRRDDLQSHCAWRRDADLGHTAGEPGMLTRPASPCC